MNKSELYQKCMKVIWSCKTEKQLDGAVKFTNLAAASCGGWPYEEAFSLVRCEAVKRYQIAYCSKGNCNGQD